jgi:hypothetical protein
MMTSMSRYWRLRQTVAFDNVQFLTVRRTKIIYEGPVIESDRIERECVAVAVPNRLSVPKGLRILRMRHVQIVSPHVVVMLRKDGHLTRRLDEEHRLNRADICRNTAIPESGLTVPGMLEACRWAPVGRAGRRTRRRVRGDALRRMTHYETSSVSRYCNALASASAHQASNQRTPSDFPMEDALLQDFRYDNSWNFGLVAFVGR